MKIKKIRQIPVPSKHTHKPQTSAKIRQIRLISGPFTPSTKPKLTHTPKTSNYLIPNTIHTSTKSVSHSHPPTNRTPNQHTTCQEQYLFILFNNTTHMTPYLHTAISAKTAMVMDRIRPIKGNRNIQVFAARKIKTRINRL